MHHSCNMSFLTGKHTFIKLIVLTLICCCIYWCLYALQKSILLISRWETWNNERDDERIGQSNTKHGRHWSLIASDPSTLWYLWSWEHAHILATGSPCSHNDEWVPDCLAHLTISIGLPKSSIPTILQSSYHYTALQLISVIRWHDGG